MRTSVYLLLSNVFILAAEIFCIVATFTPHWIERSSSYRDRYLSFGFLHECSAKECQLNVEYLLEPIKVRVSFSLMVVSCFFFVISYFLSIRSLHRREEVHCIITGVTCILASVFTVIAASIYTDISRRSINYSNVFHYGYSFALAWCAAVLGLIGAAVSFCEIPRKRSASSI